MQFLLLISSLLGFSISRFSPGVLALNLPRDAAPDSAIATVPPTPTVIQNAAYQSATSPEMGIEKRDSDTPSPTTFVIATSKTIEVQTTSQTTSPQDSEITQRNDAVNEEDDRSSESNIIPRSPRCHGIAVNHKCRG